MVDKKNSWTKVLKIHRQLSTKATKPPIFIIFYLNRYHRRFIEVASSYYVSKLNSADRETIFGNVVDFFNERWKSTPKPYKYNEYIAQKKKLAGNEAQETRDTTMQPTAFVDEHGKKKYNVRKITELPGFLGQLTGNFGAKLFCEHVFFNYDFLTGMLTCLNSNEVFDVMQKASEISSYKLNEEATECINDLLYFKYILLQNGA